MVDAQSLPSGTVTFLFTDIEGSTLLLQRLGDEYGKALADQRQILRNVFEKFGGVEIDTQGDSFFVAFKYAFQAVEAVDEAQHALASHPWPAGEKIKVRMGLHTGEPKISSTGYVGLDVHRAARICSSGHGGQVLLSEATRTLVESVLPQGLALRSLGEHRLKDLQCPEKIYQLIIEGLPNDFPALKSLDYLPTNLPLQLTSFIGREREIKQIVLLLKNERLVSLIGAGGCGKTRLALQATAELIDYFHEGVWFVDLAPLSNSEFLTQEVASVLKLHEEAGLKIQDVLIDYLRTRNVLLILDNCEHLVNECARLVESLVQKCPQLKILVTSREALGIASETLYHVPTLTLPNLSLQKEQMRDSLSSIEGSEAVRLFFDRAMQVQSNLKFSEDTARFAAQICQRLDGIALAIELAAARTRVMSLDQILARLADRFGLLTGGTRTALPRQQTLQALVDWSYDLLSEPEKILFRGLSVFAGSWSLEAAEMVCAGGGISGSEILDLLTHLVDKSLIVVEPADGSNRFRMLETIRQYAMKSLISTGEEKNLRHRHLDWYFNLIKDSQQGFLSPDISQWLARLDLEKDNLYNALGWAIKESGENIDIALEMSSGMWMWWMGRGYLSEGRQWLQMALEKSKNKNCSYAKAKESFGIMIWCQGEIQEASRCIDESLLILHSNESVDVPALAQATHIRGHISMDQGDFSAALEAFTESLELYTVLNNQYWVGTLISDLGVVASHHGDYKSALEYQEQSLLIFQKFGNIEVTSQTLHRIGDLARLEGNYSRAEECYEISLANYRELGMKLEVASNLHKLGYVAQYRGNFEKAFILFKESLMLQREVGNKQGIAECLSGLACLAAVENQAERALCLFGASQALLDAIKAPLAPADLMECKRDKAYANSQIDEDKRNRALLQGQSMELDQAIEFAIGAK